METTDKSEDKLEPVSKDSHEKEVLTIVRETEKEVEDECYDDFKAKIEVLVHLGKEELQPLVLSDCYTSDRSGMHLEILPKIIFDDVDDDTDLEEIDLPKPIFRQTVDTATQASIEFKSSTAQTLRSRLVNSWTQYEPRVYTNEEIDENFKRSSFQAFLKNAEKGILGSLTQNSIADSFFWDLSSLHDEGFHLEKEAETQLMISGSFSCSEIKDSDRLISSINWHPLYKDIFVASTLSCLPFERRSERLLELQNGPNLFYMWSVRNQFFPKLILEYYDDVQIIKFNPKLSNIIAGGSVTGQLIIWDIKQVELLKEQVTDDCQNIDSTTAAVRPCAISNLDHSHKHGITHLQWVPSYVEIAAKGDITKNPSNGYQIITCGLNGFLQFWDLRMGLHNKPGHAGPKKFHHLDGVWEPFHSVEVLDQEGRKRKSLTCFVLRDATKSKSAEKQSVELNEDVQSLTAEFYGGCDDGQVLCGNFKLVKDDAGKFVVKHPEYFKSPHGAAVTVLSCSPFMEDVFFSAGGRNLAIWNHNIKMKSIFLRERHTYITSGHWSPTRPAMFVLGFKDGSIEVWDLLYNLYEPYVVHFMSTFEIKSISIQSISVTYHVLAAGDSKGVVYTMNLLPDLWMCVENELEKVKHLIDIESNRLVSQFEGLSDSEVSQDLNTKKSSKRLVKDTNMEITEEDMLSEKFETFLRLQNIQLKNLGLYKETEEIE